MKKTKQENVVVTINGATHGLTRSPDLVLLETVSQPLLF